MTSTTTMALAPIEKRLRLSVTPAKAFAHFTSGIAKWWPLDSHSLSEGRAANVVFEAHEGGRIYEIDTDGREREWGIVMVCQPNARLVFSWVLERPDLATEVEVRFEASPDEGCVMTLIHRGWDKRPDGEQWRKNYDTGWDHVLSGFGA